MTKTIIVCKDCNKKENVKADKKRDGEYLGKMGYDGKTYYIHKCIKCKQQVRIPEEEGLNFA